MKKLLVFHKDRELSANDLETFLYDSEATRDEWLDMLPQNPQTGKLTTTCYHYSEWALALKADDALFEDWHVVWSDDAPWPLEREPLNRFGSFDKAFRGPNALCTVAGSKGNMTYAIYRLKKSLGETLSAVLPELLGHFDKGTFSHEVAISLQLIKEAPN